MSVLAQVIAGLDAFNRSVQAEVRNARADAKTGDAWRRRWRKICAQVPLVETPTGLRVPRLALPQTDDPGEIARYVLGEGLPGEFPFANSAYPEMYLQNSALRTPHSALEEPTRPFAGLGLAEDTNRRLLSL